MTDVRRATADDAEELMRLRAVMIGVPPEDGLWVRTGVLILRRQLTDPAGLLAAFVVDRPEGGLAACVVGAIDERLPGPGVLNPFRGYVYNVATDPEYRRRGYSRACMRALLAWYAGRGVPSVMLHASPDGEPLYASLGFTHSEDPSMRIRTR